MVACADILTAERRAENPRSHCGGEARTPTRTALPHADRRYYLSKPHYCRNDDGWPIVGRWDLSGSPSAGMRADAAKDFASLSDTGRIVNPLMQTFSGTSVALPHNAFINWKITRVYTCKCIEDGHPTDVKYQSTTRKDFQISFTPAPQHWGGTSGNLALKQTQSELRADFADIVKEIYEAYTEGQE